MKPSFPAAAWLLAAAFAMAPLSSAIAADAPARVANGALVDARGMTFYSFDKDVMDGGFKDLWHIARP